MKSTLTFLLILNLFFNLTYAQVTFKANVSKNELGINERLRVEFTMDKDGDNFTPPSFEGFRVVAGPNQSVSNMFVNGKRTFSKTYTYFLSPIKKGPIVIEQASIEFDGNIYKTTPINILVKNAVKLPTNPNDPNYVVAENLHLVAELSKNKVYINEPVRVMYKLYFAENIRPSDVNPIDVPKFKDFWSQNVETRRTIEKELYKGKMYNYVLWQQAVLYPQRAGKLKIAPLTLDIQVDVPTKRRDFFGNQIYTQVSKTISTNQRVVNVQPFPEQGKPSNFSGAVGKFSFDLVTSKSSLNATESLQATLKISGKGNLKLFSIHELVTPKFLERYDPEYSDNVKISLSGMSGSIQNTYTLIPQYRGKYPIPPINFSYFDPSSKTYKKVSTKEMSIDVINGPLQNERKQTYSGNNINNENNQTTIGSFEFIKQKTSFKPILKKIFFKSNLFYFLIIIPFVLILFFILFIKFKPNQITSNHKKTEKLINSFLGKAKKNINKPNLFYESLEIALINYLKYKLDIETSELDKEKIKEKLIKRSVDKKVIDLFITILKNCEYARYTPSSQTSMENDYKSSVRAILELNKEI